jgi:hypothetical protein|tara:strand:- start:671 stop:1423 length:753 start_codon:yes stop_codon:yes gene_type:complete
MKNNYLLIFIYILTLAYGDSTNDVTNILLKSFHRLDNINHQFSFNFKESGKKNKTNKYKILINWPKEGPHLKETRIIPVKNMKNKPTSFWENQFKDKRKSKRWMSMPITGKLKDISDKKPSKKFSLADLEFSDEDIYKNENNLIGKEIINGELNYIVNSLQKTKEGKNKESRKLWIGVDSYIINKVEFYTKSGRLYRTVECKNIEIVDGVSFTKDIYVKDLKSKNDYFIDLYDIKINPKFKKEYFIPSDQ